MGVAVGAAVVAGALALSAGGRPWLSVTALRPVPLPPATAELSGSQVAPMVTATGLVLLAGAAALFAVRAAGRVAVGLLMAVAGGVLVWSGLRSLVGALHVGVRDLPTLATSSVTRLSTATHPGWPAVTVVAGALAVLAGLLVVLRGRGWPAMGRRYERPGTPGAAPAGERTDEERVTAAWRALDRGEDPTDAG